jgi:ADP-ribose pyrophosphatase YjhB (NUDIX family)
MYKVFVDDKPIILTDSLSKENNYPVYLFKNVIVEEILHKLKSNSIDGAIIFCSDLENSKDLFLKNFKIVSASGGLVLNAEKEILFIYRGNKWDLPKGRIEKGETIESTAVREVEEECGIENLTIDKFLTTTYHFFYQRKNKVKETHWFLMNSNFKGDLKPQQEEGITEVIFKNEKEALEALENSYANIKLVYNKYKDLQG